MFIPIPGSNPNGSDNSQEWVLIHNNQIYATFPTSDMAYEFMAKNNLKNAYVLPPSQDRKADPKEAGHMQRIAGSNLYS
jgi:hypothetical protein